MSTLRVYPRVCGGTSDEDDQRLVQEGLSPRVRGNLLVIRDRNQVLGSIPACAGEPPSLLIPMALPRVYPRVCGGTVVGPSVSLVDQGLSPRVRGNRPDGDRATAAGGSIPACAGEPTRWRPRDSSRGVYPRVCGGTAGTLHAGLHLLGLSPRVRGNPAEIEQGRHILRSIPACAGEPVIRPSRRGQKRVYPRVCGGTPTERHAVPQA